MSSAVVATALPSCVVTDSSVPTYVPSGNTSNVDPSCSATAFATFFGSFGTCSSLSGPNGRLLRDHARSLRCRRFRCCFGVLLPAILHLDHQWIARFVDLVVDVT